MLQWEGPWHWIIPHQGLTHAQAHKRKGAYAPLPFVELAGRREKRANFFHFLGVEVPTLTLGVELDARAFLSPPNPTELDARSLRFDPEVRANPLERGNPCARLDCRWSFRGGFLRSCRPADFAFLSHVTFSLRELALPVRGGSDSLSLIRILRALGSRAGFDLTIIRDFF